MNEELKKKFDALMYRMVKDAASWSFVEYLENQGLTEEDWESIKTELTKQYGTKFYV